jgi:hypothetical protein
MSLRIGVSLTRKKSFREDQAEKEEPTRIRSSVCRESGKGTRV